MRYDRPLRALPRRSLAASALLAAALLTPHAGAQDRAPSGNGPGFDTHLFRPAVDSKGFFTVNGVDTLGSGNLSFGLVTDYAHNLLRQASGSDPKALVTHSFQGTFNLNVGLWNRLVLGVHVPLDLMGGDATGPIGPANAKYESASLDAQKVGFVAPHLKLNLLNSRQPIGLALVVQAGIPTGTALARSLGADSKFWYWPHVVVEKTLGNRAVRLGLDVGYRGTSPDGTTRFDGLKSGTFVSDKSLITGGFGVAVRALDKIEFVGETYLARQTSGKSSSKLAHSQEVVGGLKIFVEKNSHLMIGGGVRLGDGYMAADQRVFLGFIFEPSITDRDGDGIPDEQDQCPDAPEDRDGFQDDDG
ncbi:MAG: OmpA family protein, partial [Myxococcales bacterium]